MFLFEYFSITCALLVILCSLLWYYSTSTFDHWKKQNIPFRRPWSVLGNATRYVFLRQSYHEFVNEQYTYFKGKALCGIFQMTKPVLLIRDPEIIENILIRDFSYFPDRTFDFLFPHRELNPLSDNLFVMERNRWRELRKKLNPIFSHSKLPQVEEQMLACIHKVNSLIEENLRQGHTNQNVKLLYCKLSLDIIGSCAFGINFNSTTNDEFRIMGMKSLNLTFVRILTSLMDGKFRLKFKLPDFPKDVTKFFMDVVLNTIQQRRKNNIKRNDLLQMLMDLQNSYADPKYAGAEPTETIGQDERFDEFDILANSYLFYMAGYETTSSTLSFCLYELAVNQSIQDELRAELEEAYEKNNRKLTYNMLHELKYLDAVVTETLRKYVPIPTLHRDCVQDYQVPNCDRVIKKGTKIMIPVWSIHHDEKFYPNPDQFDPSRLYGDKISKATFLAFGDGPRSCIGKQFGKMEVKLAIADALLNYQLAPCSKTEIPISYRGHSYTLTAKHGIWVNIKKRQTANTP